MPLALEGLTGELKSRVFSAWYSCDLLLVPPGQGGCLKVSLSFGQLCTFLEGPLSLICLGTAILSVPALLAFQALDCSLSPGGIETRLSD